MLLLLPILFVGGAGISLAPPIYAQDFLPFTDVAFTAFTHLGLAIMTRIPHFSRMLNTGTQYFPVDSMQTSKQLCSSNQSAKRFKSELKVLNRFF